MVNGAIASQNGCRNLTTLDICAINLITGDAEFIKAGAAASFIRRGRKVEEISSDTLPLGSMEELSPVTQGVKLVDGDMIIMMSDGITDVDWEWRYKANSKRFYCESIQEIPRNCRMYFFSMQSTVKEGESEMI